MGGWFAAESGYARKAIAVRISRSATVIEARSFCMHKPSRGRASCVHWNGTSQYHADGDVLKCSLRRGFVSTQCSQAHHSSNSKAKVSMWYGHATKIVRCHP